MSQFPNIDEDSDEGRGWPPLGFLTRNNRFKYSTVMLKSSGHKKQRAFELIKFMLEFQQLGAGILWKAAIELGGSTGPMFTFRFEWTSCTIVTTDVWVKHVVILH